MVSRTRDELAGALLNLGENGHPDDDWGHNFLLNERDTDHSGDCTKQPWTCCRCVCNDYLGQADKLIAYFQRHEVSGSSTTHNKGDRDAVHD